MVEDCAFQSIQISLLVQKLWQFQNLWICLLRELHLEGSAPEACAAGLFVVIKAAKFTHSLYISPTGGLAGLHILKVW